MSRKEERSSGKEETVRRKKGHEEFIHSTNLATRQDLHSDIARESHSSNVKILRKLKKSKKAILPKDKPLTPKDRVNKKELKELEKSILEDILVDMKKKGFSEVDMSRMVVLVKTKAQYFQYDDFTKFISLIEEQKYQEILYLWKMPRNTHVILDDYLSNGEETKE